MSDIIKFYNMLKSIESYPIVKNASKIQNGYVQIQSKLTVFEKQKQFSQAARVCAESVKKSKKV
jgi:hypothetical protein